MYWAFSDIFWFALQLQAEAFSPLMPHTWQAQKTAHVLSAFEPWSQEHHGIKEWEKISAKGEINLSYYID